MKTLRCRPCGASSPYWDWVERKGTSDIREKQRPTGKNSHLFEEIAKGDPDSMEAPTEERREPLLQAILDVIDEGGEQVLTRKQQKAFQLIVREGVSYRQAARTMRVSVNMIVKYVKAGAKKLRILALTK